MGLVDKLGTTGQVIVIDKPSGISSARMVNLLKPAFKGQKIGHAGTLDPFASGVLIILVGSATKLFNHFQGLPKTYLATIIFGQQTNTLDPEGRIIRQIPPQQAAAKITKSVCQQLIDNFPSQYTQTIPLYSAVKYQGKPLYWWARQGKTQHLPTKTKKVSISQLKLINFTSNPAGYPTAQVKITVSSGFYVRQWAADLGRSLEVPSYLLALRRLSIGEYQI